MKRNRDASFGKIDTGEFKPTKRKTNNSLDNDSKPARKIKQPLFLDMDFVYNEMSKTILSQNTVRGFSFYETERGMTDYVTKEYYRNLNNEVVRELSDDIDANQQISQLSQTDLYNCNNFYQKNATVRMSSTLFKESLFETPFDVALVNQSGVKIGEPNKDIKDLIVKHDWMPALERHYDWIKICGICPFYFEPIGIRNEKDGKIAIHYVPRIPLFESGVILTYANNRGKQGFIWKWASGGSGKISLWDYDSEAFVNEYPTNYIDGFSSSFESFVSGMALKIGRKNYLIKKSKYMFFDVKKSPSLLGSIMSDINTVIPEWKILNEMLKIMLISGRNMSDPSKYVEFAPDIEKANSGDKVDMLRLQLEILKEKYKSPTFGLETYSSTYGQDISTGLAGETSGTIMDMLESTGDGSNNNIQSASAPALGRIISQREKMRSLNVLSTEMDLGISHNFNYATVVTGDYHTKAEIEKIQLHALNNPSSQIASGFNNFVNSKYTGQHSKLNYLAPYEKLATSGATASMPNFDIKYFKSEIAKTIASVCDYPLELFKGKSNNSSGKNSSSATSTTGSTSLTQTEFTTKMDMLKMRLRSTSRKYEVLIEQWWIMAYAPIIKEQKGKIKTKHDSFTQYEYALLQSFNNIKISFPRTPFLGMNEYKELYHMGMIDEVKYYQYVADTYGLEKKELTAQDIKKIKEKNEILNEPAESESSSTKTSKSSSK